jgi:hypothetical protein
LRSRVQSRRRGPRRCRHGAKITDKENIKRRKRVIRRSLPAEERKSLLKVDGTEQNLN